MKSILRIDSLIHSYIETNLSVDAMNIITHFDCQDTEDNNETECYFYIKRGISEDMENELILELSNILGLSSDCAIVDKSDEYEDEFRIEFIVEICSYRGNKFE